MPVSTVGSSVGTAGRTVSATVGAGDVVSVAGAAVAGEPVGSGTSDGAGAVVGCITGFVVAVGSNGGLWTDSVGITVSVGGSKSTAVVSDMEAVSAAGVITCWLNSVGAGTGCTGFAT